MAVTVKELVPAKYVENAQTTQFTAGARTVIDKATLTNVSAGIVEFSANIVADGDTAASDNLVIVHKLIATEETYTCPELVGQVLEKDSFLSTLSDTASALVIRVSGRELT